MIQPSSLDAETLRQLIQSCRRSRDRVVGRISDGTPSDWCPHKIPNPNLPDGFYFSDQAAWEFIADRLEAGEPYKLLLLDTPPGAVAITMEILIPRIARPLYIKVQIGVRNRAIGRSFHESLRY